MRVVHAINVFEKFINVSKAVLLARFLINPRSNFSPVTFFVPFSFFFSFILHEVVESPLV